MRHAVAAVAALPATLSFAAGGPACGYDPLPPLADSGVVVRLEAAATGLAYPALPTDLAFPDDGSGRIFAAGLGGVVSVVFPDGTPQTFIDTRNEDTFINPLFFGMTCIALHPGFTDPDSLGHRRLYTITTETASAGTPDFGYGTNHTDVLHEWMVSESDPDAVDPASKRELLRVLQPGRDHNVSDIAFLPEGLMHVTSGDGGNNSPGQTTFSDNAQDTSNIFGTILRIDPLGLTGDPSANGQYSIPQDNPFVGVAGVDEIFAYGLRSPFRINADRGTGDLYVGDVGQLTIEEINRVELGGNYGWNIKEGTFLYDPDEQWVCPDPNPDPALIDPVGQYDHTSGRSVVGGFVYRGEAFPALQGKMIFADFQGPFGGGSRQGLLLLLDLDTGEVTTLGVDPKGAALPRLIYTVGEDPSGEVYIAGGNIDGSVNTILKLVPPKAPCPGDLNADTFRDFDDLGILLCAFGQNDAGDIDGDGDTDFDDLALLLGVFGVDCP